MPGDAAASVAASDASAATVVLRNHSGNKLSNWRRPKSHMYELNYTVGSRMYSEALSKVGRNSELAIATDIRYTPSVLNQDSLDSLSVLDGQEVRKSKALRSSHARQTDVRKSMTMSWVGTGGNSVVDVDTSATSRGQSLAKTMTFDQVDRMQSELRAREYERDERRARRRQVSSLHEEHLRSMQERDHRNAEIDSVLFEGDLARERHVNFVSQLGRTNLNASRETVYSVDPAETIVDHEHEAR